MRQIAGPGEKTGLSLAFAFGRNGRFAPRDSPDTRGMPPAGLDWGPYQGSRGAWTRS